MTSPFDFLENKQQFFIQSATGLLYANVDGGVAQNGAQILLSTHSVDLSIKWTLEKTDDGHYLCSALNPDFVLHLNGGTQDNGAPCTLWDKTTHGGQGNLKVNFEKTSDGLWLIKFVHSNKSIRVEGSDVGSALTQSDFVDQNNFKWSFIPVKKTEHLFTLAKDFEEKLKKLEAEFKVDTTTPTHHVGFDATGWNIADIKVNPLTLLFRILFHNSNNSTIHKLKIFLATIASGGDPLSSETTQKVKTIFDEVIAKLISLFPEIVKDAEKLKDDIRKLFQTEPLTETNFLRVRQEGLENHFFSIEGDILTERYGFPGLKIPSDYYCKINLKESKILEVGQGDRQIPTDSPARYFEALKCLNTLYMNKHEVVTHLNDTHLFCSAFQTVYESLKLNNDELNSVFNRNTFFFFTLEMTALAKELLISSTGVVTEQFLFSGQEQIIQYVEEANKQFQDRMAKRIEFKRVNSLQNEKQRLVYQQIEDWVLDLYSVKNNKADMDKVTDLFNTQGYKNVTFTYKAVDLFTLFVFQAICGHTYTNYEQYHLYRNYHCFSPNGDLKPLIRTLATLFVISQELTDNILNHKNNPFIKSLVSKIERTGVDLTPFGNGAIQGSINI